ncbi:hypothetical protein ACMFMG_010229 [Clarireedia jacksonii]
MSDRGKLDTVSEETIMLAFDARIAYRDESYKGGSIIHNTQPRVQTKVYKSDALPWKIDLAPKPEEGKHYFGFARVLDHALERPHDNEPSNLEDLVNKTLEYIYGEP